MFNIKAHKKIQEEALKIAIKKHTDYSSVVDAIEVCGVDGLTTRIFDKAARLLTLSKQKNTVRDESMRDTAIDLINYATFLVNILDNTWKEK